MEATTHRDEILTYLDQKEKRVIASAARERGMRISPFIRYAALKEAKSVLAAVPEPMVNEIVNTRPAGGPRGKGE